MGPMKAMKVMKSTKKTGLGKPKKALGKAKAKAKALGKAQATNAKSKNDLNKANLEKLGQMSLNDKIKAAAEQGETIEEQALILKDSLTKDEHSQVWGRHQTHLNNNPLEKGEMEGLSKKEKGLKAAAWLMQVAGKTYLHVSKEVSATESLKKGNKWESEKQMLEKFD